MDIASLTENTDGHYIDDSAVNGRSDGLIEMEPEVAAWLEANSIACVYEPHCFRLGNHEGFQPDFYLPELDMYIEVCTRKLWRKAIKVAMTVRRWPNVKIVILTHRMIKDLINGPQALVGPEPAKDYLRQLHADQIQNNKALKRYKKHDLNLLQERYPNLYQLARQASDWDQQE